MTEISYSRDECIRFAELHEAEVKSLEAKHGTGVRPSWVSTDIAIAEMRAKAWREAAANAVAAE